MMGPLEIKAVLKALDDYYKTDPWAWLTSQVYTQDEATQRKLPWPDKVYLKELLSLFQSERLIVVAKSRRMMASWTVAAWAVYNARYFPHHAIFIQSETEQKAAYITDKRCVFIEENLREPLLRRKYRAIRTHQGSIGRITYDDTGSYIWAIPQGGSVIRSYTFSILLMDESDFQAEGREALLAALPIAEKGAQIILMTTSNGPNGVVGEICREVGFTKFS